MYHCALCDMCIIPVDNIGSNTTSFIDSHGWRSVKVH